MVEIEIDGLSSCPLCGKPVMASIEKSPDGSITWVSIYHGPTIPCGISFLATENEAVLKWNARVTGTDIRKSERKNLKT